MNQLKVLKKIAFMCLGLMASSSAFSMEMTGCVLENNKVLSLTNLDSVPTYSYGTTKKNELTLSEDIPGVRVYKQALTFGGGLIDYIRFQNGDYSYVAFNGRGKGWIFSGLIVYKGNKVIMSKSCKGSALDFDLELVNAVNDPSDKYEFAPDSANY
ncbi:MAG: hypothetical protein PHN76_12995 [Advenella sp.]|uniref:hypothetical protein n=1 Tax=Advenella sp. TaxID=1872388 RepID=UPI00258C9016|nr:hypothetical protein [Advenella sp.]MDD3759057.1 hypothetical protein [Advenella sp.]